MLRDLLERGRKVSTSAFPTRVITDGVVPSLHIDYKKSRIKQYHKLLDALRTETTINDARDNSWYRPTALSRTYAELRRSAVAAKRVCSTSKHQAD